MFGLDLELVSVLGPHVFPFTPSAGTEPTNKDARYQFKGENQQNSVADPF
jgi:hypothetical protein